MTAATQLSTSVGCTASCRVFDLPRASFYRARAPGPESHAIAPRPKPRRALSDTERQTALVHLHSERFVDQAPPQVHATLLDEGLSVCSLRTMYRLLQDQHPERFVRKPPPPAPLPDAVWINPPKPGRPEGGETH